MKTAAEDDESRKDASEDKEKLELNEQLTKLTEKYEQIVKEKETLDTELRNRSVYNDDTTKNTELSKEERLRESLRKDSEEVQDLRAEIVVIDNENKQLKTEKMVCITEWSFISLIHFLKIQLADVNLYGSICNIMKVLFYFPEFTIRFAN